MKKLVSAMLTLVMVFSLLMAVQAPAKAATNPWAMYLKGSTKTVFNVKSMQKDSFTWDNSICDAWSDDADNITKVKVTSSDKKVATVKVYTSEYGDSYAYFFTVGAGKTTIKTTITYKGKDYTYSTKLTVKKWVKPVKTLKIGSKSYDSKFKSDNVAYVGSKKGKLNITAAKGWKVKEIKLQQFGKTTKIKNKATIDLGKKNKYGVDYASNVTIKLYNSKTKVTEIIKIQNNHVAG